MNLIVKGKQLDIGEALRRHVEENLAAIADKYFGDPIDATVVLAREGHRIRAHVSVHVGRGIEAQGEAEAEAPYAAFDAASEHLAKRLRRYKRRLRDHRRRQVESEPARQFVLAGEESGEESGEDVNGQPAVIAEMTGEVPTLSVGEAVMRLDLADDRAILFRNRAHGGLNMVYRRADGNVGWVDPRGNRAA